MSAGGPGYTPDDAQPGPHAASLEKTLNITLIGCGKMGTALLEGWWRAGICRFVEIVDPGPLNPLIPETAPPGTRLALFADTAELADNHERDAVILAVKPQIIGKACTALAPLVTKDTLILSIAAGQKLSTLGAFFPKGQPVVRAMPNLPATIGKGITVACHSADAPLTPQSKDCATALLTAVGDLEWIAEEELMDAVTAVSGSGPAYLFYLVEALAAAGEKAGLPPQTAMLLARRTVTGAAALIDSSPEIPPAQLRENVTSPGGTTAAALKILMDGRLQALFNAAIAEAAGRSRELSRADTQSD